MNTYDYTPIFKQLPFFVQEYINHLSVINRTEKTRRSYVYEIRNFLTYLCNETGYGFPSTLTSFNLDHMSILTHRDIEAYLGYAQTKCGNGPRALARKQGVIKSLYRYLLREGLLATDITIKLDPIKLDSKLPKALEPDQIAHLSEILDTGQGLTEGQRKYFNCTEKRDRAILMTLIGTGLRLAELCAINIDDINFKNFSIRVMGKGNKEANVYFNDDVEKVLKDYVDNERPRYDKKGSDALFLSMQCKRISNIAVERLVKKYMRILASMGYNTADFSTHKLRSTTATMLLRETDNLAIVQDYLRHSDPKTTRKYAKILDEQLKQAAKMIKFK